MTRTLRIDRVILLFSILMLSFMYEGSTSVAVAISIAVVTTNVAVAVVVTVESS